jgi:ADP-heptose:LPS heptosyltransferase
LRELLLANPYLTSVHILDHTTSITLKEIGFDLVIDLQNNWRSWKIRKRIVAKTLISPNYLLSKWLLVHLKINQLPNEHRVETYFKAVKSLDVKPDLLGLDHFIPEKDEVDPEWLPEPFREKYAVFGLGADHFTKRLPIDKMIELCAKINMPIILIGGMEDKETGDEISAFFESSLDTKIEEGLSEMNQKTMIFNAAGSFSVNQHASIIKKASHVFTHDNYVMQMAAAFKKQIFSIWGSTVPSFGKYPYKTRFWIFENKELSCRPCSVNGLKKCPEKHFNCMNALTFDFYLE